MTKYRTLLLGAALVACRQEAPPENAVAEPATNAAIAKPQCEPPMLATTDKALGEDSAVFRETRANFSAAYASACAKGMLKDTPLIDPELADKGRIFLHNAPEANVASIYPREGANRMVLEYHFLTPDGQPHVPPADEIEEAIYCKLVGATTEEEESTGRCLPD